MGDAEDEFAVFLPGTIRVTGAKGTVAVFIHSVSGQFRGEGIYRGVEVVTIRGGEITRCEGITVYVESFINESVTIIVSVVANFRGTGIHFGITVVAIHGSGESISITIWDHRTNGDAILIHTYQTNVKSELQIDLVGNTVSIIVHGFVNEAIAVVVDPVQDFSCVGIHGRIRIITICPTSLGAGEIPRVAESVSIQIETFRWYKKEKKRPDRRG